MATTCLLRWEPGSERLGAQGQGIMCPGVKSGVSCLPQQVWRKLFLMTLTAMTHPGDATPAAQVWHATGVLVASSARV